MDKSKKQKKRKRKGKAIAVFRPRYRVFPQVLLPGIMAEQYGFKPNMVVQITMKQNKIIITPVNK